LLCESTASISTGESSFTGIFIWRVAMSVPLLGETSM
jgi:hypothetical protein